MPGGSRRRACRPPFIPHCTSSYKLIHSDNKSAARLLQHARRALAINQKIPSMMRGQWGRLARGAATAILCNWQVGLIRALHGTLGQTVNRSWMREQLQDAHLRRNTLSRAICWQGVDELHTMSTERHVQRAVSSHAHVNTKWENTKLERRRRQVHFPFWTGSTFHTIWEII